MTGLRFCGVFFFFFQAEDGIRDGRVTGVQTVCSSDLGEKRGDEDDRGKHLEGERKTEAREFFRQAEIAENKSGACVGEAEKLVGSGAEKAEDFAAERRAKDVV